MRATSPSGSPPRAGSPGVRMSMLAAPLTSMDIARFKRNNKGGIFVSSEELHTAFELLDMNKTGMVTLQNLQKKLSLFFPEMTAREYRFLMNNKKELTEEDLAELLVDNDIQNFDPTADAFRAFDPLGQGFVSTDKLREVFAACKFGELGDEELDIMCRAADIDGDGVIGLEDFRALLRGP